MCLKFHKKSPFLWHYPPPLGSIKTANSPKRNYGEHGDVAASPKMMFCNKNN